MTLLLTLLIVAVVVILALEGVNYLSGAMGGNPRLWLLIKALVVAIALVWVLRWLH